MLDDQRSLATGGFIKGKFQEKPLNRFGCSGMNLSLGRTVEMTRQRQFFEAQPFEVGEDEAKPTFGQQKLLHGLQQIAVGQFYRMAHAVAILVVGESPASEEGWIANDEVVTLHSDPRKVLDGLVVGMQAVRPRAGRHVVIGLGGSRFINLHAIDLGQWLPLRQHDGHNTGSRANIENFVGSIHWSPGPEQDAIGAHFHAAAVLGNGKLFELKRYSCLSRPGWFHRFWFFRSTLAKKTKICWILLLEMPANFFGGTIPRNMEQAPLELSEQFRQALDRLEKDGANLFITGKAGTGKSTLLQLFRNTTRKRTVVLAPTGVAALNVRGQTIHSFFGFPPRLFPRSEVKKRRDRRLYRNVDVLIIDEISMVRADLLDHMDYFLRLNRDDPRPFGGLQVVFFGDLFQLPPVVATEFEQSHFQEVYPTPYFFSAELFSTDFSIELFELRKVYRQDNRHFLRLLEAVRLNHADEDDLAELNERFLPGYSAGPGYITLTARNATADRINQAALHQLPGAERLYPGKTSGDFNPQSAPADQVLKLKPGAQVMLLKNDAERRYVNGTLGKVLRLSEEQITVEVEGVDGQPVQVEVEPVVWESLRYALPPDGSDNIIAEVVGSFTQFPLKLAWAITIHKAQGKTFDKVVIDLGSGAFEHGQTYVALSRCRTLEGIVLRQPIRPHDIRVDERILDFYQAWQ